jgi:hypothetical protein
MSDKPDRPHDKLFKETFTNVAHAAAELRAVLPTEVVALLRWETLRLESGNFEVASERRRFCDLLFSCERASDRGRALVYVLFEHQSSDTPSMMLRMLRYMVQIWERWLETKQGLPLPPILPVVLSHDERGWRSARRFADLFEADEGTLTLLRRFVPDFEIVVDDIAKVTDDGAVEDASRPADEPRDVDPDERVGALRVHDLGRATELAAQDDVVECREVHPDLVEHAAAVECGHDLVGDVPVRRW